MKDYNDIDKLFEEQLGGMRVEPSVKVWEQIASGLDAAEASARKKRFLLWFSVGAAAAILAYVFFFNRSDAQSVPEGYTPTVVQKPLEKAPANVENTTAGTTTVTVPQTKDEVPAATSTPELTPESQEQNTSGEVAPPTTPETPAETEIARLEEAAPQQQEKAVTDAKASETPASAEPVSAEAAVVATQMPERAATQTQNTTVTNQKTNPVVVAENQETGGVNNSGEAPVEAIATNEEVVQNEVQVASEEITAPEEEPVQMAAQETAVNESEEAEVPEATENAEAAASQEPAGQSESEQAKDAVESTSSPAPAPGETAGIRFATAWSVDVVGGPAWTFSSEKTETPVDAPVLTPGPPSGIISPVISINLKYHVNNWFIQSGIGYAEYGEDRTYFQKLEMHDTSGYSKQEVDEYYTYDSTGIYIDTSGVIVITYDAIFHSDTSYKWVTEDSLYYEHLAIQAQNRYRYIEIPLMVGYEFRFKNLGFQVSTGVSFGMRVNTTGKFLDSQNNLVDITPDNSPYTNMNMNYILSVGLNYHLNRRFSVTVQPVYKTNLNSLFAHGSSPHYNQYGVNMGINYIIE